MTLLEPATLAAGHLAANPISRKCSWCSNVQRSASGCICDTACDEAKCPHSAPWFDHTDIPVPSFIGPTGVETPWTSIDASSESSAPPSPSSSSRPLSPLA